MGRLTIGSQMPDFIYETPFEKHCTFSDVVKTGLQKTVILFHRFYGCRLCQYDLQSYAKNYDTLCANGAQMLAVVQSGRDSLAKALKKVNYPFPIICDPSGALYKKFEILPAESRETMLGEIENRKMEEIERLGLEHGDDEGNPLQLPAIFAVDKNRIVCYAYYGKTAGDVPSLNAVIDFLTQM